MQDFLYKGIAINKNLFFHSSATVRQYFVKMLIALGSTIEFWIYSVDATQVYLQ